MSNGVSEIADALVSSGALKFGKFKLKSGVTSPYYIDLTWLLSSPRDLRRIVKAVVEKVREISSPTEIDKLASIELKGALLLPLVASKLNMPCIVVRKESKKYGLIGRIAGGKVKEGERILFFDDVVTNGKSKLEGIKPLEQLGAEVDRILVVIDREQGGKENLREMGYQLESVTTISRVIRELSKSKTVPKDQIEKVLSYIQCIKEESTD